LKSLFISENSVEADQKDCLAHSKLLGLLVSQKEHIEASIDFLLDGLCDPDSSVRWSSAKGLAKIANRLPYDLGMVDDTVGHILWGYAAAGSRGRSCLYSWHGACLSLAELARSHIISPKFFNSITTLLSNALFFETQVDGRFSGESVRDSACFLIWAIARAYSTAELSDVPYIASNSLAKDLINVALFDRDINVRRAACACFQECVGRLGEVFFPSGIALNTVADFFTVGDRRRSYLQVSVDVCTVGKYNFYSPSIVEHLSKVKIFHWDESIRELAAEGLFVVLQCSQSFSGFFNLFDFYIFRCKSDILPVREGALLGLSSLLRLKHDIPAGKLEVCFCFLSTS
jgi:hypothetical protein